MCLFQEICNLCFVSHTSPTYRELMDSFTVFSHFQGAPGLKGGEGPQGPQGPIVSMMLIDIHALQSPKLQLLCHYSHAVTLWCLR